MPLPPVTLALLVAVAAGHFAQLLFGDPVVVWFALWPIDASHVGQSGGFLPWQLLTYALLHGGLLHLFLNGFAIYMFGPPIERLLGSRAFGSYFVVCVIGAAVAQLATLRLSIGDGPAYPTVGASGGVFGLLLAFGMFYPRQRILLLIPPIPMPAWLFVTLYGALELYLGVTGTRSGIAHFAHLGGMVTGFLMILYWRGKLPIKPKRLLLR